MEDKIKEFYKKEELTNLARHVLIPFSVVSILFSMFNPVYAQKKQDVLQLIKPVQGLELKVQDGLSEEKKVLKLEEAVKLENYSLKQVTPWENITLSTLIPLKEIIERESNFYRIDPLFATKFFIFESSLIPIDSSATNDYGLGQISSGSMKDTIRSVVEVISKYYNPRYDRDKSLFDPQNNIILSLASLKYIMNERGFEDYNQAYAVYVRGGKAVNKQGVIQDVANKAIAALNKREEYIAPIIPLFLIKESGLDLIKNDITRGLMKIYYEESSTEDKYKSICDFLYDSVIKNSQEEECKPLLYETAAIFHVICNELYSNYSLERFDELMQIGKNFHSMKMGTYFAGRIRNSLDYMEASKNNTEPFISFDKVNKKSIEISQKFGF